MRTDCFLCRRRAAAAERVSRGRARRAAGALALHAGDAARDAVPEPDERAPRTPAGAASRSRSGRGPREPSSRRRERPPAGRRVRLVRALAVGLVVDGQRRGHSRYALI